MRLFDTALRPNGSDRPTYQPSASNMARRPKPPPIDQFVGLAAGMADSTVDMAHCSGPRGFDPPVL